MPYRLNLKSRECLLPTPSGAYHVACTEQPDRVRRLLFLLMEVREAMCAKPEEVGRWADVLALKREGVLDLLHGLAKAGFVEAVVGPVLAPVGALEDVLPPLLRALSGSGRALLADRQGLYIANAGFTHETAEEVSALGADVAALHARHRFLINHNLGLGAEAWGLIDAAGGSRIGFWPLRIGVTEFSLAIADVPYLNQRAFRDLVWVLSYRYSQEG